MIVSWRRIGRSETRVNARSGAPRRSGPYSGNAWTLLPSRSSASARIWAAVFAPCPARACQRISVSSRIAATPSSAATARLASRTAWTTLAPPLTASPAAKIFGFAVRPSVVDGLEQREELVARPLADRLHDRVDGNDELAAREPAPAAGGRSRPARRAASPRSGRPRRGRCRRTRPGCRGSGSRRPSRRASSTSCSYAGISCSVRR